MLCASVRSAGSVTKAPQWHTVDTACLWVSCGCTMYVARALVVRAFTEMPAGSTRVQHSRMPPEVHRHMKHRLQRLTRAAMKSKIVMSRHAARMGRQVEASCTIKSHRPAWKSHSTSTCSARMKLALVGGAAPIERESWQRRRFETHGWRNAESTTAAFRFSSGGSVARRGVWVIAAVRVRARVHKHVDAMVTAVAVAVEKEE